MRQEMHNGEIATLHFPQRICARVASGRFRAAGLLTASQRAVRTTCTKTWGRQQQHLCTQHGSQCVGFFPTGFSSAVQQQRPDNKLPVGRGSPLVDRRSSAGMRLVESKKKNVLWLILGPAHAKHRGAFLKDCFFKRRQLKKKQEKAELRHDSQHFLSRKKKKTELTEKTESGSHSM